MKLLEIFCRTLDAVSGKLWSALARGLFGAVGPRLRLESGARIIGGSQIKVGSDFSAGRQLWLAAISYYQGVVHRPILEIGDRVNVGDAVHIACMLNVTVCDDVLIGSRVHITDHSHGCYRFDGLPQNQARPIRRPLYSAGPVMIERNVWICDGAIITGGVSIGEGSVIAANSVVTKDVPPFSLAAGSPAKVLKTLDQLSGRWSRNERFL